MEKNLLFKNWGVFVNTSEAEQYEISKVVIFKDGEIKMIANCFLDNFADGQFEFYGETKRKLKIDLSSKINFVVKSENQNSWNDKTQYTLFINGGINNYIFVDLELIDKRLDAKYKINNMICSQCIGWNQKESNKRKYHDFNEAYKKINTYSIDNENMLEYIKDLEKAYKKYIKAAEIEKTYTPYDYKKMQLSSGTTQKENMLILKNNGFDISGIKEEE